MSKWPASWRAILVFILCCLLGGCLPNSEGPVDEEKDPNFIEGRNHENMMDWKGAVEAFERAVQANPRNASAHFWLGVLYQDRMNDPISAAYHYQKHLELRPNSGYLEPARQRLQGCKMDIAKTVTFVVVNQDIHRDLKNLTNELVAAKKEIDALHGQIAVKPTVVTQWMKFTVTNTVPVYYQPTNAYAQQQARTATTNIAAQTARPAGNTAARVTPLPAPATNTLRRVEQRPAATFAQSQNRTTAELRAQVPSTQTRPRAYVVKPGETMAEVARRTGVNLQRLQAANPTIEPRRLRAGQTLNIPSQ